MAIEVKQMDVVPISEVRDALWANRCFPALLIATVGRFSAGIVRESKQQDTRLRPILKDSASLSQWLDAYGRRRMSNRGCRRQVTARWLTPSLFTRRLSLNTRLAHLAVYERRNLNDCFQVAAVQIAIINFSKRPILLKNSIIKRPVFWP